MCRRTQLCVMGLLVLLTATRAMAASVSGLVADVSGAVLVGARVTVRGLATGPETAGDTHVDGRFRI